MDDNKYIIIEVMGHECAVVLDNLIPHSDVGRGKKIVSAGFFRLTHEKSMLTSAGANTKVQVFGESTSLEAKSRGEEDAVLIHRALFGRNW